MASIITAQGLEEAGKVIAALSTRTVRTMSFDDQSTGFTSAATKLNDAGAVATFVCSPCTATTVGTQTVRYEATLTTAQFNGQTVRRFGLHFDTTANVTTASNTLYGGIDGQSIAKTSDYSLIARLQVQQRST